ncbi:substrate-binding periplasmic protein [Aeromonas enteropelogenes]|uniref:substrate-binding periplasmic protein n=1 Tax=Aeromonas enteropelogenes TaxID=29489 RepID=UPI003BA0D427
MTRWTGLAGLLLATLAQASPELGKLHYITEENSPYNYRDGSGMTTGFAVELLQRVWQQTATPPQPIDVMPWARGYSQLSKRSDVVLFSAVRTRARDPLFKWACPIDHANIVLIGLTHRHINLDRLEDAKHYIIAAGRADVGEQLLIRNGFQADRMMTSNRFNHAIKMLTSGRADLLSTNKNTFYQRIGELGLAPDQFRVQWTLSADPFCYAFSLAVSDQLVAEFQQGLEQVLTSPTYPALRRRYLPE